MRGRVWAISLGLLCFADLFCLAATVAIGFASSGTSLGVATGFGEGTGSVLVGSPFVIPGSPLEGEELQAQRTAVLSDPAVVAEREASRTRFSGLNALQAENVAREAFPRLFGVVAGGVPSLRPGISVTGFPSDRAVSVDLGGGRRGVIESLQPLAVKGGSGRRAPLDLALTEADGGFTPVRSLVGVRIPKRLGEGLTLGQTGVSLTLVSRSGGVTGGSEGLLDGAGVLYANTAHDTDTAVKATPSGFDADSVLRSVRSPDRISYRVGLPAGARLLQRPGSRAVLVLDQGRTLATVAQPSAVDADGTPVPVEMSVSGNLLTVDVRQASGRYAYPIAVDPSVVDDKALTVYEEGKRPSNWVLKTSNSAVCKKETYVASLEVVCVKYSNAEYGVLSYSTQGESQIYELELEGFGAEEVVLPGEYNTAELTMHLVNSERKVEPGAELLLAPRSGEGNSWASSASIHGACVKGSCANASEDGSHENTAQYGLWMIHSGEASRAGVDKANVRISQEKSPELTVNKSSETVGGKRNVLVGSEGWIGPHCACGFEVKAHDPGVGISRYALEGGGRNWENKPFLEDGDCGGVQCAPNYDPVVTYNVNILNGEQHLAGVAEDAVGLKSELGESVTVKVDNTQPYRPVLSGLPANDEIGEGEYTLKAEAGDGNGSTKVAGIASLALTVDGREVGKANGSCAESLECKAKGEWTINGGEFGAGAHTLTVTATDYAGNTNTETVTLKVHHASPVALGPGAVNPQSGEFSLNATDVSISVPGSSLAVSRSYRSRHLTAGTLGPLGPQWSLAVGGQESITKLPNGNATLTAANGGQTTFTSAGSGTFTSPTGDANLTLSESDNEKGELVEYVLRDAADGASTHFTSTSGPTASVWKPSKQEGPLPSQAVRYSFWTLEGESEPHMVIAPEPEHVSCGSGKETKELKPGCRALVFEYAGETTAKGEAPSEWGSFKGRLADINYWVYSTSAREMQSAEVAVYKYDAKGRLREEWNQQIPTLKTTYAYDAEGHVTAISPPGEQPWLMHYGTIPSDKSTGRLLSVTRPAAVTPAELKIEDEEAAPVNTKAPTLSSTTPVVGTKISVASEGSWSNNPTTYSYTWEDCNSSGAECAPIPGAVNQSYYPATADEGHKLVAEVSAFNPAGAVAASSAATSVVASGTPNSPAPEPPVVGSSSVWTVDYQVPLSGSTELPTMTATEFEKWGQTDTPVEAMAIFPPDKPMGWPAKAYARASVEYLDDLGRTVNTFSPMGGVSTSEYNTDNDVIRTLSPDGRAAALKETCESKEKCKSAEVAKLLSTERSYEEKGSEPGAELLSTLGPQHTVELSNGTQAEARLHTLYSYNEGAPSKGGPYHLVTKTTQGAVIAGKEEAESVRTTTTSYSGQEGLGWTLRKPTSVTTDPAGLDLVHVTEYEPNTGDVSESKMPAATGKDAKVPPTYLLDFGTKGSEPGQFNEPRGIAVAKNGNVLVIDTENARVEEFTQAGKYETKFGSVGSGAGQMKLPYGVAVDPSGNVWVTDNANNRVDEFNEKGGFVKTIGFGVATGASEFQICTKECKAGIGGAGTGQLKEPRGIGIGGGYVYVVDGANNRVEQFSESGAFVATFGNGVNEKGEASKFEVCMSKCKAGVAGSGEGQFKAPRSLAVAPNGYVWVVDSANNRVQGYGSKGEYKLEFGSSGSAPGKFKEPKGIGVTPAGTLVIGDGTNNRVQEFTSSGAFLASFGEKGAGKGQFEEAWGIAVTSTGDLYVGDLGNDRVQEWVPTITGNEGAHDTKTTYYSAEANSEYPKCGEHPEWADLVCQARPAAQPESGLPELPVTTIASYNIYDEPVTSEETIGSTTRVKTESYGSGGRPKTVETSSSVGATLPKVTYGYTSETGAETGAVMTQSTTTKGETETITSVYNTLGQLTSYTDAEKNTATYEYDLDGRVHKTNDGKGTQTYTYNEAGELGELVDSSHEGMKFTATYDAEGDMLTESYPNGMLATYTYNTTSSPVALEYKKTTHCTEEKEKCVWFKDSVTPSIHGQWLSQTSTFSKQAYTYDAAGRLTQVQSTPVGKGCTTRIYAYDEDTNRTSLTTREPNAKGECATEGGTIESHTYDTADQLTDSGITYNEFGDITTLPEQDAEKQKLTSTYYADNQLDTQTQGEQTIGYNLDPAGRTRETVATGSKTSDLISHYAGPGSSVAWTENKPSGETSRNIPGINGQLAATQTNSEAPVLQIANLHGDLIATAALSETATELTSKADTTEFGVPTNSLPPKYSWLGAIELPTELPSGVIAMGARSYVPQLGRFLQPDPIPGGSANAYAYTFGDPVNSSDPSGDYTFVASYVNQFDVEWAAEAAAREGARVARAAEEAAARLAAEIAAQEAAAAAADAGPQYAEEGGEEWEEWWEEEGGYEEAAYHPGSQAEHEASFGPGVAVAVVDNGEGHVEDAVVKLPFQSQKESSSEQLLPSERCGQGTEGLGTRALTSSQGRQEDVSRKKPEQCPRLPAKDYRVRIRGSNGSWTKVFDTYCGIVGGAFLTPGVDVFGAPAEVGCAGYGVVRGVEAIVEAL